MQSSGAEGLRKRMQDLSESNNLFAYLEHVQRTFVYLHHNWQFARSAMRCGFSDVKYPNFLIFCVQ